MYMTQEFSREVEHIAQPDLGITNSELIDLVVESTDAGALYNAMPPRWPFLYKEDATPLELFKHKSDFQIHPNIFLYPKTIRDLRESPVSDADPVGHLKLLNHLTSEWRIHRAMSQNADEINPKEAQDTFRVLGLVNSFHDFHECETGDKQRKIAQDKLDELLAIYQVTLESISDAAYQVAIGSNLTNDQMGAVMINLDEDLRDAFRVFLAEPKLYNKYGLTQEGISEYFHRKGVDVDEDILASGDPFYKVLAKEYEDIHSVSFLAAGLSIPDETAMQKALKYDIVQNTLIKILREPKDPAKSYRHAFVQQNRTQLDYMATLGYLPEVATILNVDGFGYTHPDQLFRK